MTVNCSKTNTVQRWRARRRQRYRGRLFGTGLHNGEKRLFYGTPGSQSERKVQRVAYSTYRREYQHANSTETTERVCSGAPHLRNAGMLPKRGTDQKGGSVLGAFPA